MVLLIFFVHKYLTYCRPTGIQLNLVHCMRPKVTINEKETKAKTDKHKNLNMKYEGSPVR